MTRAIDNDDVEVELPVEIIQHIQTSMIQSSKPKFRGEKAAARTSLVSKSWYRAWSTRPDLVFCLSNFPRRLFWEGAKTTLKRYEDLNLNIRSLRLVMTNDDRGGSRAKELIVKAIKMGVVDLTIQIVVRFHCFPDDDLEFENRSQVYLCGFRSFAINVSLDRRREKEEVTCYNLIKSLELKKMALKGDLFWNLKLRCPFIEEFLGPLYNNTNVMDYSFLDKLLHQFPKLEYLSLGTQPAPLLPRHEHLWPKFACLKELNIDYHVHGNGNDGLRIRIPSLERITITLHDAYEVVNVVELDFPNIRKFKFDGRLPWRFELKTSSTRRDDWESEIFIDYWAHQPSCEWLTRLCQCVRMLSLSRSRVSLAILTSVTSSENFRYFGDGLAIPRVEKLTLRRYQILSPAFLDALFWVCRPKFVEIDNSCLYCLKRVNVEEFQQLRLLPWQTFYQVYTDKPGYDVRFQLD